MASIRYGERLVQAVLKSNSMVSLAFRDKASLVLLTSTNLRYTNQVCECFIYHNPSNAVKVAQKQSTIRISLFILFFAAFTNIGC